jgi:hypothetical protein
VDADNTLTHLILTEIDTPLAPKTHLWVGSDAVVRRIEHHDAKGRVRRS